LAAEFEALVGGALNMALAQEAEPGDPLRECWLAQDRLRCPQVTVVVSLVETPSNCGKAAAVAKEAMAIKYGNMTSHWIKKFLESPSAGKHPKPISEGTKAAAAEAAVTAAEAIVVADLEEANRLGC
jgi:hypothetical protein